MKSGITAGIVFLLMGSAIPLAIAGSTYYIRAGAAAGGNGLSWNTAWQDLPASLQRGSTYYVAAGTYGQHQFKDPENGTEVITIKKATARDHGADDGWQSDYAGVTTWMVPSSNSWYLLYFTKGYYQLDGGSVDDCIIDGNFYTPTSHLVRFDSSHNLLTRCTLQHMNNGQLSSMAGDNNIFTGLRFRDSIDSDAIYIFGHDQLISKNEVVNLTNPNAATKTHADFVQTFGSHTAATDSYHTAFNSDSYNIVIEDNYVHDCVIQPFMLSTYGMNGNPAPPGSDNVRDWTFRNNVFANVPGTGFSGIPNTFIYNNVFYKSGTGNRFAVCLSNNNSVANVNQILKNNVFLECGSPTVVLQNGFAGVIADHNYVAGSGFSNIAAYPFSEPSDIRGGDPRFVDVSQYDFHLLDSSPLKNAGATIAGFNTDKDGVARPQDAAWDIGAYEYCLSQGGPLKTPAKPRRLKVR